MSTITAERLTRDRIIDAAADIASRDGIDGLSMRRLADELGVSTMAAYRHVASRWELTEALLLRALDEAQAVGVPHDYSDATAAQARVELAWLALEAYPGLRFELRHDGAARDAWAAWLSCTLVGLLVGMDTLEQASRAARAVVS